MASLIIRGEGPHSIVIYSCLQTKQSISNDINVNEPPRAIARALIGGGGGEYSLCCWVFLCCWV